MRHCARRLKHIARLPDIDKKVVLRALRKTTKKRKKVAGGSQGIVSFSDKSPQSGSQASVNNNDWSNRLVVHGNDKIKADDVRGIGKTVGLNFEGNTKNMFDMFEGNTHFDFSYQPSMEASGGLLTLWDNKEVKVCSTIFFEHV